MFEFGTPESIIDWGNIARPAPTDQQVICQAGVHLEEGNEMFLALTATPALQRAMAFADAYKTASQKDAEKYIQKIDHKEMLDGLCDQIVTALNTGNMLGYDMLGALAEVDMSNWSKFEDGEVVLVPGTTKIGKGKDYVKPNLEPFLGTRYANKSI